MDEFTNWDIISSLLLSMRWTVLLSLIAFAGGTLITPLSCSCSASPAGKQSTFSFPRT